jgi:hypothetical protein
LFSSLGTLGGFNFILFWNIIRNQTENERYWQKNNLLRFAKCLKMYNFFTFALKLQKNALMTRKQNFVKNINMDIKKRRILGWFQIG